jgi:RNA polymerase sigma factor (sigma-70 family)
MPEKEFNVNILCSDTVNDLILKAKSGDQTALSALIPPTMEYLFPCIYKMLMKRLASGSYLSETLQPGGVEQIREDAWQITHNCCCSVIKNLHSFRGRNIIGKQVQFTTWLYSIGQNEVRATLRSRWRERRRRVDVAEEASWEHLEDLSKPHIEERIEETETTEEILEALQSAPLIEEQREAVIMYYCFGYKQTKIAELTGVQIGTVKKRIFDGINKVRNYLNEKSEIRKKAL